MLVLVEVIAGIYPAHPVAAVVPLEILPQVGKQNISLYERVAEIGDAHRTADRLLPRQPVELAVEMVEPAALPGRIVYDTFRALGPYFPETDRLPVFVVSDRSRRLLGGRDDFLEFLLLSGEVAQNVNFPQFRPVYLEGREEMEQEKKQCHQQCQQQGSVDIIFHLNLML